MKKHLGSLLVFLTVSWLGFAGAPPLKEARTALMKGNYSEARALYTELAKKPENRAAATLGLSKAHESVGDYDEALEVIETALKDLDKNADLLARKAELLHLRGRWAEAEKAATESISLAKENFQARWILGQLLRDKGDWDKANEEFRWFFRTYNARINAGKDLNDSNELLYLGLAVSERARFFHQTDLFQTVLNDVYNEAMKKDRLFWPAEYEAGRLFVEKYNKGAAERALDRALTINPRAAEALAAKGSAAFANLELKDADHFVNQALKINPRLTTALRLRSDIDVFGGDLAAAHKSLKTALVVNPRDEATLARVAALLVVERKENEFKALIADVEKANPKPNVFYTDLADRLEERKLYADAESYYRKAVEMRPEIPWALNGLGAMYMRLGKEPEARKILDQAFDADNFNVRVANSLKVLKHLDKYETVKTDHFILRFDPNNDKILSRFMLKYLEEIYQELVGRFDYRPKEPILIEVFNKHEMFSGRVVAVPDLHTIGACTGRMIAMVSPKDTSGVISKPFSWVRVLRHELVHVFNLEQTNFRIPHWFTEGLAVTYEGSETPPRWLYILADKVQKNELLNLDNILLGFVRPRSPDEWNQAYAQSQLYVEYITKTYGDKAVGRLLAAYANDRDTDAALEETFKVKKADFETSYRKFLETKLPKGALLATQKNLTLKELKAEQAKKPDDPDLAAQLADRLYQTGNKEESQKFADQALVANNKQALAGYVKAMIQIDNNATPLSLSLLQAIVDENCKEPKAIKLLGKLQFEAKKFAAAGQTYEIGKKLEPYEPSWYKSLSSVYTQAKETDKLIDILKHVARFDYDDVAARRTLAEMLHKAGNAAEAESFARQALEIDVNDSVVQTTLREALRAQNKAKDLDELEKLLAK